MYRRLEAELAFYGMTKAKLAEVTGIRYDTLLMKLNGESPLKFEEAMNIKRAIGTAYTVEELFDRDVKW